MSAIELAAVLTQEDTILHLRKDIKEYDKLVKTLQNENEFLKKKLRTILMAETVGFAEQKLISIEASVQDILNEFRVFRHNYNLRHDSSSNSSSILFTVKKE